MRLHADIHVGRGFQVELLDPFLVSRVAVEHEGAGPEVDALLLSAEVSGRMRVFGRIVLDEDIVVETVVAVKDGHESHHLRAVRNVIRGISLLLVALDEESRTGAYVGYGA